MALVEIPSIDVDVLTKALGNCDTSKAKMYYYGTKEEAEEFRKELISECKKKV